MHMTWLMAGFPIRRFPDQSLLTAPRNLSQSSTSFIGNIRLGIHCSALEYLFMHWSWLVVGSHQLLRWRHPEGYLFPSIPLSYHQKFQQIVKLPRSPWDHTRASFLLQYRVRSSLPSVSGPTTDCKELFVVSLTTHFSRPFLICFGIKKSSIDRRVLQSLEVSRIETLPSRKDYTGMKCILQGFVGTL